MKYILLIFLLIANNLFSQKNKKQFIDRALIETNNTIDVFLENRSLKNVLIDDTNYFLGFYGVNKEKVNVKIFSVIKDIEEHYKYFIYGKMKCQNRVVDFQGSVLIKSVNRYIKDKHRSLIQGRYKFIVEFVNKKLCSLEGDSFYKVIDENGILEVDYTNSFLVSYFSPAIYIGDIIDSDKNKQVLNWGGFQPPLCGDLDIGKDDFIPNPKYQKFGWKKMINTINYIKKGKHPGGIYFLDDINWRKD